MDKTGAGARIGARMGQVDDRIMDQVGVGVSHRVGNGIRILGEVGCGRGGGM